MGTVKAAGVFGTGRGWGLGSLTVPFFEVLPRENSKMLTVKAAGVGRGGGVSGFVL